MNNPFDTDPEIIAEEQKAVQQHRVQQIVKYAAFNEVGCLWTNAPHI